MEAGLGGAELWVLLWAMFCLLQLRARAFASLRHATRAYTGTRSLAGRRIAPARAKSARNRKKPDWVPRTLLRLAAHHPALSHRKLRDLFNRLYAHRGETVGLTYVHYKLRAHRREILELRRQLKHRHPWPVPPNAVWGLDLTGKTDSTGRLQMILGILDHGSRRILALRAVPTKVSLLLLGHLLITIAKFGRPRAVRTDNEAVWTSRLFTTALLCLGIRHQRTDVAAPWQNGRIERFRGTLKQSLRCWAVANLSELDRALALFAVYYNEVRPHQHLGGCTPYEVWHRIDPFRQPPRRVEHFSEWDGLLTGIRIRH